MTALLEPRVGRPKKDPKDPTARTKLVRVAADLAVWIDMICTDRSDEAGRQVGAAEYLDPILRGPVQRDIKKLAEKTKRTLSQDD